MASIRTVDDIWMAVDEPAEGTMANELDGRGLTVEMADCSTEGAVVEEER